MQARGTGIKGCGVADSLASHAGWVRASTDLLRALNSEESQDALLHRVARHACELLDTDACSVMVVDDEHPDGRERLVVRASHALTENYRHHLQHLHPLLVRPDDPDLDLPATQAFREGRTVVLSDVREWRSAWRPSPIAEGIRSVLAMPLGVDGVYTGVLIGYTTMVRRFTPADLALAELMAQYVAVVLRSVARRDAEARTIDQLRVANDRLTAVVGSLRRERERREWAERQDRKLMRLLLDDVGLDGVLTALAEALAASVVLEDPEDGSVIGRHPAAAERLPVTKDEIGRGLLAGLATVDEHREPALVRGPRGESAWVVPVAVAGELVARLWVIEPAAGPGDHGGARDRSVIERFSLLVAFELLKRRYAVDTELRLTRDLAVELVGGAADTRGLIERARALGHDLSAPHVVVRVPLREDRIPAFRRAATLHTTLTARLGVDVLVGEQDGALVVLVPEDDGRRASLVKALSELAVRAAPESVGGLGLHPGAPILVGPTVRAVEDYPSSWRTVRGAAALAAERPASGILDLEDLGVAALLLDAGTPESLRRLADRRLGPLEDYDRSRDSRLVDTLRTWLGAGCSTAETARIMHLHPHTVSYRLRRVAELSGLDPQHTDGVFELRVAVMVRAVQQATKIVAVAP